MIMSEYLSTTDLHRLTGYARPGKQAEWLKTNGVAHRVDGARIIVSSFHAQQWLEGRTVAHSTGPNWGAVK